MSNIKPQGQFNRQISAERLSRTQNDSGGMVETWTPLYATWAYVGPVKSYRHLQQLQNVQTNSYEVQIRFTEAHPVDKDIRFKYEGKILILNSREEVTEGRKRFLVLILVEQD